MGINWAWSYIDNTQPWLGAKATITGSKDTDDKDRCPASPLGDNSVITTVLFTCTDTINFQGTDTFTVTQYPPTPGTGPCMWTITGNMKTVCPLFAPNYKRSSSSSSTGGSGGPTGGDDSGGGGGLSGGWVFIIILLVLTFVYCVGGALFMKFQRQASGMDLMPNYAFWREIPGLVKDGCLYACNKIRGCRGGSGSGDGPGYVSY